MIWDTTSSGIGSKIVKCVPFHVPLYYSKTLCSINSACSVHSENSKVHFKYPNDTLN